MGIRSRIRKLFKHVPEDEKVFFDSMTLFHGHKKVTYKDVKAIRCPFDYVMYQMIIFKVKPDLIIEIGTNEGGGALYLADLLTLLGKGEVHAIDINNNADRRAHDHSRIKFFTDGWENYSLENTKGFETILVIEDAAHSYECTRGAMDKFASVVSVGSYFIIEDGIVNDLEMEKLFEGGPLKAIREFLPNHPEYIVDREYCDMFGKNATFNVNGYLKRIK